MPRPVLLLIAALLTVTGMTVSGLVTALRPAPVSPPVSFTDTEAVAHRYYTTINEVIATGRTDLLYGAVAGDFLDHASGAGLIELELRLSGLHAADPEARLVVTEMLPMGDGIAVQLHARSGGSGAVAGIAMVRPVPFWEPVEVLRIRGDLVRERWAPERGTATVRRLGELDLTIESPVQLDSVPSRPPARRELRLERLRLAPGAALDDIPVHGPRAIVVNVGSVVVTTAAGKIQVKRGEELTLREDTRYALHNDGVDHAELLMMWVSTPRIENSPSVIGEPVSAGVDRAVLAPNVDMSFPIGNVRVALAEARLTPLAELGLVEDGGPILVTVMSGQLGMMTAAQGWVQLAGSTTVRPEREARLEAGDQALLDGTSLLLWNAGPEPVVLLIAAVHPVAA